MNTEARFAHNKESTAGLLASGLIPSMRHAIQNLMAEDMIVLPAAATVFAQAVEARTTEVCAVDMSAVNQFRWHPAYLSGERPSVVHFRANREPQVWSLSCLEHCLRASGQACPSKLLALPPALYELESSQKPKVKII